jgi:hypothetical protein
VLVVMLLCWLVVSLWTARCMQTKVRFPIAEVCTRSPRTWIHSGSWLPSCFEQFWKNEVPRVQTGWLYSWTCGGWAVSTLARSCTRTLSRRQTRSRAKAPTDSSGSIACLGCPIVVKEPVVRTLHFDSEALRPPFLRLSHHSLPKFSSLASIGASTDHHWPRLAETAWSLRVENSKDEHYAGGEIDGDPDASIPERTWWSPCSPFVPRLQLCGDSRCIKWFSILVFTTGFKMLQEVS